LAEPLHFCYNEAKHILYQQLTVDIFTIGNSGMGERKNRQGASVTLSPHPLVTLSFKKEFQAP